MADRHAEKVHSLASWIVVQMNVFEDSPFIRKCQ